MKTYLSFLILIFSMKCFALDDPTRGKAFFPWLWQEQVKPTVQDSADTTGLVILGSGTAATLLVMPYDRKIRNFQEQDGNLLVGAKEADDISDITHGPLGIGIALTQLLFDQENGLMHSRALLLTSISHLTIATITNRSRPDKSNRLSFPSGHTSSAFATAGSLAYAYGLKAGIPAYLGATLIGIVRIKDNKHWGSDVLAGATLGSFWAHASYKHKKAPQTSWLFMPSPIDDGLMLSMTRAF